MNVVSGQFQMKGGVRDTLFGLIGSATGQSSQRTLGGLVSHSPDGKVPTDLKKGKVADATERHIGGPNKTMSSHLGQISYSGKFMTKVGQKL